MCGRYSITTPVKAMRRVFRFAGPLPNLRPHYNVAPTQKVPKPRISLRTRCTVWSAPERSPCGTPSGASQRIGSAVTAASLVALIIIALSACSHLVNESYLRQGCRDYAAALSQLGQLRSVHRVTAAQIKQVDQQNVLVVGDPASGRYGVCTTPYEPSNPSGANDTVKYGRNVLRGFIDAINAATPAPNVPSPSVPEHVSTYINAEVFESVVFESWATIVTNTIAAKTAWERS